VNLARLLERNGKAYRDFPAIGSGAEKPETFGDWAKRVRSLAGFLAQFERGSRIAIAMANDAAYFDALFAIWHAGLIAVPINAKLHRSEFAFILENSGAKLVATDEGLANVIEGLAPSIVIGSPDWKRAFLADPIDPADVRPEDPAWIFYTSGTTGRPKGATLSHRNLMAMTWAYMADIESVGPGQTMIHPAPLSHGSGLYSLPFVACAACNVVPESGGFSAAEITELLKTQTGVSFFAAPTMIRRLLDHPEFRALDKRNLNTIIYGGAPMHLADLQRAMSIIGSHRLAQIYGQGESPMTITALGKAAHADNTRPGWLERLNSVGIARTGTEVSVVDETGRPLPVGETGEIVCRGDVVMSGYWENPDATRVAIQNGWLRTGDMGAFDEAGYLFLKDRSKDVIINAGSNIYPREVEEVLLRHDDVQEVSVVGRPHADRGEEVVAFVVRRPGASVDRSELDALCLASIARFKRPRAYFFVEELPKNNYGKVLKTELRKNFG
jgi:long-chain acyl-CoA synthetase